MRRVRQGDLTRAGRSARDRGALTQLLASLDTHPEPAPSAPLPAGPHAAPAEPEVDLERRLQARDTGYRIMPEDALRIFGCIQRLELRR